MLVEVVNFVGSEEVSAIHPTTLEITRAHRLTGGGDCIIGIDADKGCATLSQEFKDSVRGGHVLRLKIVVGDTSFGFVAYGDSGLQLADREELVVRKSDFVSPRTLGIRSSAAAIDVPREMIALLKNGSRGVLMIEI